MMKVLKFLGNIVLTAVIGFSMVSCPLPTGGNGGNTQFADVEASAALVNLGEESEWEWLLATKDGSVMLFDVNETTGMPSRLYLKPADKAAENGITFLFKENGLPDVIECNGYLIYFDNFSGYTFDLAAIAPDGSVEYHFGIETDKDFDAWNARAESGGARSVYGERSIWNAIDGGFSTDPVGSVLDVLGFVVDIATCFAIVFFPPLLQGCVTGIISFALDTIIFFLEKFLEQYEDGLELSLLAKDGYLLVTGALDCVRAIAGKDLDGKAWFDCIGAFVGAVSLITGVAQNLFDFFFSSGTKAEVQEEMIPPPSYSVVNFHANGGSGAVPATLRVETGTAITLPSEEGLSRDGYFFIGWSTSPNGSIRKNAGSTFPVEGNTSFYAQWRENLPAPTGLTATSGSSDSITLSWSEVSGADGYYVYRATNASETYSQVETLNGSASTLYLDDGLPAATRYYYKVSYYKNNYGESLLSGSVNAVTMVPGEGISVTFSGVTANGSILTNTTALTLTFSAAIAGLSANDITLSGVEGIQKGTLSGSGPAYTLGVSGFSEGGTVSVAVLKSGYNIHESVQSTSINYLEQGKGIGTYEMVYVQGGTFQMGPDTSSALNRESPLVTLSSFYIGKYEVTQWQWEAVMGTTLREKQIAVQGSSSWNDPYGNYGRGDANPMYWISWYEAVEFCNALSVLEGLTPYYTVNKEQTDPNNTNNNDTLKWLVTPNTNANGYRLPTEAEWEYAARGGNTGEAFYYAGSNTFDDVAWHYRNIGYLGGSKVVGTKAPNGLGIYDMSGNVWEWCWDWFDLYPAEAQVNPTGPSSGAERVERGGSYGESSEVFFSCRGHCSLLASKSDSGRGIRVVRPAQ